MLKLEHIAWDLPDGEEIIRDIDITVGNQKMVVVTGPNGGGKTTLAKLIAGIVKPASGRILLDGEDITDANVTERAKKGIAYAFQQPVKFKGLTVRDLLELSSGGELDHDGICQLLGNVGLCADEYIDREMSGALSGGESKRIEIATVLARNARLSIFDEPEAGIDLWSFTRLVETFQELQREKKGTLLVISHQERIADGKVRNAGPRDKVLPTLLSEERTVRCPQGKEDICRE